MVTIIDHVSADTLMVDDKIIIDGEYVEVKVIIDTADPDEVLVRGYSHDTGDVEDYSLCYDDIIDIWEP